MSLRNLSIWERVSQPALLATPKLTEGGSEVEWVRAELRALTIQGFSFRSRRAEDCPPYLFLRLAL